MKDGLLAQPQGCQRFRVIARILKVLGPEFLGRFCGRRTWAEVYSIFLQVSEEARRRPLPVTQMELHHGSGKMFYTPADYEVQATVGVSTLWGSRGKSSATNPCLQRRMQAT